jgi:hypothetical protein
MALSVGLEVQFCNVQGEKEKLEEKVTLIT